VQCVIQYTIEEPIAEDLTRLRDLAANLRWTWDRPTQALSATLSPTRRIEGHGNPVELLRRVTANEVESRLADPDFRQRLRAASTGRTVARPAGPGVATGHGRLAALGGALLRAHPDGPWGEHAGRTPPWPLLPVIAREAPSELAGGAA